MDMSGLSSLLWRERDILDNLLFKLDVQQLLLMSGRSGWLVRASREIETALEQVRIIELERAVRFDESPGLRLRAVRAAIRRRPGTHFSRRTGGDAVSLPLAAGKRGRAGRQARAALTDTGFPVPAAAPEQEQIVTESGGLG